MIVFITGSTGLLGYNIVNELLVRNISVRALVRRQDARRILGPTVELVEGDLQDIDSFEKHLAGSDVLIHAAACYGEYYRTGADAVLAQTNVTGTVKLLEAAARQGIQNIIYISSSAVLETQEGSVTDEYSAYAENTDDPYFSSKIAAEKAVYAFMATYPHVRLVMILPTVMLGPGDRGPTPTGSFVLKLIQGKIKLVLPGLHRIADARDVAKAVVEAISKGKSGERYLLGGRKYSLREIYQAVSDATGNAVPTREISPGKLMLASRVMWLTGRITGRPPLFKPSIVKRLQKDFSYSSDKARRELGVSFRPLSETMKDTVQWFQNEMV